jgi:LysR family transcriptional regulator, hydrogen peroxide-inducible genes activator
MLEPHLTEVLTRTQVAKETADRVLCLDSAELKLGVMCTIGPVLFVSFLSRFRADNSGIAITLSEAVPRRLCDMLVKGELDVALIARPDGFAPPLQAQRCIASASP